MTAPVLPTTAPGGRDAAVARRRVGFAVLLGLLAAVSVASLFIGSNGIGPGTVLRALIGGEQGIEAEIVRQFRVPRLLLGLAVGCALGLAGAVMQALTRNPLADPGLLGVSAGACTGVVIAIGVLGLRSPSAYVWFALVGAALASALVYALGSAGPAASGPGRLALAGAAVTSVLLSIVRAITLLDPNTFDVFRFWVVGSLAGRPLSVLWQTLPFIVVGAVMALMLARSLDALALGTELAKALGGRPTQVRALAALAVVLLSGAATAAVGPIAFVGLVVPHAVRGFTGPSQRWIMAYSMAAGPLLLIGADVLGRVIAPGEVQVGVGAAVIGAPIFILMIRGRRMMAP